MKKLISLILVAVMLFSVSVPAFAAEEVPENPTIYVTGAQTNDLYNKDGEKIYKFDFGIEEMLEEAAKPAIAEFLKGALIGDYSGLAETLNGYLKESGFANVVLDGNGEASNGSHPQYRSADEDEKAQVKYSDYGIWDYRFWYDWRLSPVTTAEELKIYIDKVREATGKKVQLVGRCYGANVIQAYITLYKEHAIANVSDVSYFASSVAGIDYMSALFSGEISLNDQAVKNFVEYYLKDENVIEDETLEAFVVVLLELFKQVEVLGIGTDTLGMIIDQVKGDIIPELLPSVIGTWPSYWAMVTPELYEKAIEFIYGDRREEYKGLIEKTDKYHYEVQLCAEETILELQEAGINFYNFTKYGYPEMPLYEGATVQGDSTTSVPRQSFGAQAADYGTTFSPEYIKSLTDTTYLSPDLKINAATALIPERTWFVKNLHHDWFGELHDMALEIMRYDLTVDNEKYPQFLERIDSETLIPVTGTDADYKGETNVNSMASIGIRFVTALLKLLVKLFTEKLELGSFDLGSLIG